jgi:hypothetical protein
MKGIWYAWRARRLAKQLHAGKLTLNEARAKLKLPPIQTWDGR